MVTVFGLGFVGLTTSLYFAELGFRVFGVEANKERYDLINTGNLPFIEPGLDEALSRHLDKNFTLTNNIELAIAESEFIFYCVGTPYSSNGQADLTYLYTAIDQTISAIKDDKFRVVVIKSTIPPSTTSKKIIPYIKGKSAKIGVSNNPEFLREGYCWDDVVSADRIVLGIEDERSNEMLKNLYAKSGVPIFSVSLNTGEFIKYLSNTLLATLISYSNEMSILADLVGGIDVSSAFKILHLDKRWNNCSMTSYVYPGCGYGGYCLPKDTNAIYALANDIGFDPQILKNVISTNDKMPSFIANKIENAVGNDKSKVLGILGLSFKSGSDDVRDTPSAKIISELNKRGYNHIIAYDPVAKKEFLNHYKLSVCCENTCDAVIEKADLLIITTAWSEFKDIRTKTDKQIIDCRYML